MQMVENNHKRKVSSLSRGFGISVIATSPTTSPQLKRDSKLSSEEYIHAEKRPSTYNPPRGLTENMVKNLSTQTAGDTSIDSFVDDSMVSSAYSGNTSDMIISASNASDNNDILDDDNSTLHPYITSSHVDVSLSTSTLRRSSFNKQKYSPKLGNSHSPQDKKPILSQRFRSSPSLITPTFSVTSPIIAPPRQNRSSLQLSQHSPRHQFPLKASTTTKLPRRRSAQPLTKKEKDKLFDNDNDYLMPGDENMDMFMYNVPIASASSLRMFQNAGALQSTEALKKAWNESESNLIIPPSPLPGKIGNDATFGHPPRTPISVNGEQPSSATSKPFESPTLNKTQSFNTLSPTARQLSTFYEYSSHNQAMEELEARRQQPKPVTDDPKMVAKIDDLSLASSEKLAHLTVTRPAWIPPKNSLELHKHEQEFKKLVKYSSKKALKNSKHLVKLEHDRAIGDSRLKYLSEKPNLTYSNCKEVRKYILVSEIEPSIRFKLFQNLLAHKVGKSFLFIPPFSKENAEENSEFPDKMDDLDVASLFEKGTTVLTPEETISLQTVLQPIARPIPSKNVDISLLPKVPALPLQTMLPRLAKIGLTLLRKNYSVLETRSIVYWLHVYIFTFKFKASFDSMLTKDTVTKLFKDFKDDYSILSIPTGLDLILDLPRDVLSKCIELIIVFWCLGGERGTRLFFALIACIIRDYHFGWNNLQVIFHSKAHLYIGDDDKSIENFFTHVLKHYGLIN
ncbi:hypothetical protein CAS74_004634 [Pichia kudriavzevii]|uniref:SBE2/SBE22 middle domain-containing protein n=1 Tax=Pichia kudriavzevii TaxID=4909 RepID=A0A1Z8JIG9_PICKU|nr:hypothetical protein CAS74_004634 [Pichia kudriavzevii]